MDWSSITSFIFFWLLSGFITYGLTKGAHIIACECGGWRYTTGDEFTCWFFAILPVVGFMPTLIGALLTPYRPRWHFALRVPKELRSLDRPVWRSRWYCTDDNSEEQRRANEHREKKDSKKKWPPDWRLNRSR